MKYNYNSLRYVEHYGIIMHTSLVLTGQRSHFKAIQMQITETVHKPR